MSSGAAVACATAPPALLCHDELHVFPIRSWTNVFIFTVGPPGFSSHLCEVTKSKHTKKKRENKKRIKRLKNWTRHLVRIDS